MINTKLSEFLRGKELPLSKSLLSGLTTWLNRLKAKTSQEGGDLLNCSPFAIRACLEAIYTSYGKIKDPEQSAIALYEHLHFRKIPQDGNPYSPKMMFTLFNGGKALGSKVKIAKFYLIMTYEMEDL